FDSTIYASVAVGAGTVYATGLDGSLRALNAQTGAEGWRFEMGGPAYSSPTLVVDVGREAVYCVTEHEGLLYALDGETGNPLWQGVTGTQWDWRSSSPVIVDGVLFVGSNTEGELAFEEAS